MEYIKKTIDLPKDMVISIQTFSNLEDRSFNAQARVLLTEALKNRQVKK